jgi:hypothetical protein
MPEGGAAATLLFRAAFIFAHRLHHLSLHTLTMICCPCSHTQAMGNIIKKLFGNKDMRILMLGLDAAGKTSEPPL